jgi:tetratricopeptide (TPR) repeat protein
MSSALLSRLENLAKQAGNEVDRALFRAQWAGAVARLGHIGAAREEIEALRRFNATYEPRLTAWILLAEGQVDHFESLSVTALDKFKRAYGIGVAIVDPDIKAFAAAWMSASEFQTGRYELAAKHSLEALVVAPDSGCLARSRAHLVLANILCAIGRHTEAPTHYTRARHYAIEAHDISMQSAVLYNVAAFRIARISLDDAMGDERDDEVAIAELELNSILNLDRGIGVDSLNAMVPILQGQLMLIKRKWSEANQHYARAIPEASTYGPLRWEPRFLAEQAQCQAMMGHSDEAANLVSRAVGQLTATMHFDDLAASHARISLALGSLGQTAKSDDHMAIARECVVKLSELQSAQRQQLESLLAPIGPPE